MSDLKENLGACGDGGAGREGSERYEKDEAISAIGRIGGEVLRTDRGFAEVVNRFVGGVDVFLGVHIAKRVFLPCFFKSLEEGDEDVLAMRDDDDVCDFCDTTEALHEYFRARLNDLESRGKTGRIAELKQSFVAATLMKTAVDDRTIDWRNPGEGEEKFRQFVETVPNTMIPVYFARCLEGGADEDVNDIHCMDLSRALGAYLNQLVAEYRSFEAYANSFAQNLERFDTELSSIEWQAKLKGYYFEEMNKCADYNEAKLLYDEMMARGDVQSIPVLFFNIWISKCGCTVERNSVFECMSRSPVFVWRGAFHGFIHRSRTPEGVSGVLRCMCAKSSDPNRDAFLCIIESRALSRCDFLELRDRVLPDIMAGGSPGWGQALLAKLTSYCSTRFGDARG